MRTTIVLVLLATLCGCGHYYEQDGLIRWPNGNCAWPCIGGGGGGETYWINTIEMAPGLYYTTID